MGDVIHIPTITIGQSAIDDSFYVEVLPPPDGIGHDREFQTHRAAYGYASGLKMVTGWRLLDLTGGAA
jgi:hypothetical protein